MRESRVEDDFDIIVCPPAHAGVGRGVSGQAACNTAPDDRASATHTTPRYARSHTHHTHGRRHGGANETQDTTDAANAGVDRRRSR